MKSIQEPTGISKHHEAILWINRLMIDLKLFLSGEEPTAPLTVERLKEFDPISRDLLRCQIPQTTSRYDTRTSPKHADAVDWLNHLVMDVMKPLLGYSPESPVTMERLMEYRTHRESIEGCKTSGEAVY